MRAHRLSRAHYTRADYEARTMMEVKRERWMEGGANTKYRWIAGGAYGKHDRQGLSYRADVTVGGQAAPPPLLARLSTDIQLLIS